ncbi:hypothetical protein [Propionivibrio sp.]|uniref:hypothetical protein n=1 Tax=Propionivibrio sp. TaxID=2212460 RepID=UPI0039E4DDF3
MAALLGKGIRVYHSVLSVMGRAPGAGMASGLTENSVCMARQGGGRVGTALVRPLPFFAPALCAGRRMMHGFVCKAMKNKLFFTWHG